MLLPGDLLSAAPQCAFSVCQQGLASTCDHSYSVDCSVVGGTCQSFTSGSTTYAWCNCGTLAEGQGQCIGSGQSGAIVCSGGQALSSDCGQGFVCVSSPTQMYGLGCNCDNKADGVCPDTSCTSDPDCAMCTPNCSGRTCGDNGCGGSCGRCSLTETCTTAGTCQACVPQCSGRACGPDGCGATCGTCPSGAVCRTTTGTCAAACTADCTGRICGSDGCGGSCGSCGANQWCKSDGTGCQCNPLARVSFTVATSIAWPPVANGSNWIQGALVSVKVQLTPLDLDGTPVPQLGGTPTLTFEASTPMTQMQSAFGCSTQVKVQRTYQYLNPPHTDPACSYTDTVDGSSTINIPAPTPLTITSPPPFDGLCTAPAL
jgi:hypothetical protein